jgi:hypothetical protein
MDHAFGGGAVQDGIRPPERTLGLVLVFAANGGADFLDGILNPGPDRLVAHARLFALPMPFLGLLDICQVDLLFSLKSFCASAFSRQKLGKSPLRAFL